MPSLIGIRSYFGPLDSLTLKRDALLFERIGVPHLNTSEFRVERIASEMNWLRDQEIVYDPIENYPGVKFPSGEGDEELFELSLKSIAAIIESKETFNKQIEPFGLPEVRGDADLQGARMLSLTTFVHEFALRQLGSYMRNVHGLDAIPMQLIQFDAFHEIVKNVQIKNKSTVAQVVIKSLPVPDDSVSWEQIIDFRNDPDSKGKLIGLRYWMNEVAGAKLSPIEIEQKIEWLIHDYEQHIKLHRMKTNVGMLETLIIAGLEILESVPKLQISKAAKGLFSIRQRKVALLEGELKSPGREIAFISKARSKFRS